MEDLHGIGAWIGIAASGAVGLWGLSLAILKREPGRAFTVSSLTAVGLMLAQGAVGLVLFGGDGEPGSGHLFYGMVIAVAVAFAYIYRLQFEKRPALSWGLFLLFLMGAGFRAVSTVGSALAG